VIDLSDPDWPLALWALRVADGYTVDSIVLAPDLYEQLKKAVPREEITQGPPFMRGEGVRVYEHPWLEPGDGYATLRNGGIRRIFGRAKK